MTQRFPTGLFWAVALGLAALSQAYLLPKVFDVSDAQDFRLIWLAGDIWADGENPYSAVLDARYEPLFGERRPSHFWVYPPYWYPISTLLGGLSFPDAALVWNLANAVFLWAGAAGLVLAIGPRDSRRAGAMVLLLGAVASFLQATPITIALGQTSLVLFCGVAFFVAGVRRNLSVLVMLGLVLTMLKPQVGVLLLVVAGLDRHTRAPAALALMALALAALPGVVSVGLAETIAGFAAQLGAYNSTGAVANLPEHLVGLQKILSLLHIEISSTPLILAALVGLVIAHVLGVGQDGLLLLAVLAALFATGLHTYDLTLVLTVLPFAAGLGRPAMAVCLVGFALIARPGNLAAILSAGSVDSTIFPGSLHATVGLVLIGLALVPTLVSAQHRSGGAETTGSENGIS